jgi:2-dehydropantoate 2-reductase
MKICVFGVGGVGGYFGGKIAAILNQRPDLNHEIYFIARGTHLIKIQEKGLILKENDQEPPKCQVCKPTLATSDVTLLPKIDLFLICVKSYDLDEVVNSIIHLINEKTWIIPLLNGVNIYDRIRNQLKSGTIFPASVYVGTHIEEPGIISQKGGIGKIILGPDPQFPKKKPQELLDLLQLFSIKFEWLENPDIAIWSKFIFISGYGLVCAAVSKTIGEVYENLDLRMDVQGIMKEIEQIARAQKIILPKNIIEDSLKKAQLFSYDTKTSFQRDVETIGKQNESDIFGQAISDLGNFYHISTPITQNYYKKIMRITI